MSSSTCLPTAAMDTRSSGRFRSIVFLPQCPTGSPPTTGARSRWRATVRSWSSCSSLRCCGFGAIGVRERGVRCPAAESTVAGRDERLPARKNGLIAERTGRCCDHVTERASGASMTGAAGVGIGRSEGSGTLRRGADSCHSVSSSCGIHRGTHREERLSFQESRVEPRTGPCRSSWQRDGNGPGEPASGKADLKSEPSRADASSLTSPRHQPHPPRSLG